MLACETLVAEAGAGTRGLYVPNFIASIPSLPFCDPIPPLFRGRSHFEADFVSGAARQLGARGQAEMEAKAAELVGGEGPWPL